MAAADPRVRNSTWNSKVIRSCTAMKMRVALLLYFGVALQLSLSIGVDALRVHPAQFPHRIGSSPLSRTRDSHATLSKVASRLSIRQLQSRTAVIVSGSLDDTNTEYETHLKLGTPPREFEGFVADTGSDVVWVQCADCTLCLPDEPDFQPNSSTTFRAIPCSQNYCKELSQDFYLTNYCPTAADPDTCEYLLEYGTGYSFGRLSSDVLTVSSEKGQDVTFPNFVFGCAFNSGDGVLPIMGLSRSPFSLVGQLEPKVGKDFSICFPAYGETKTTRITLGSRGVRTNDLKFTPLIAPSEAPAFYASLYYLNVAGISINGKSLHYPKDAFSIKEGGIIFDTGTSVTSLADNVYDPLMAAVKKKITYPFVKDPLFLCFDVTSENITSVDELNLPSITFHFQDLDLQPPTANLYFIDQFNPTIVCLAIISNGPAGSGSIFGNYQMQDSYFLFDLKNNRIGFKPDNC